jgi:hypothetical protein
MAAIASISISDGTNTRVYTPAEKDGNQITWLAPGASAKLQPKLYLDGAKNKTSADTRRVRIVMSLPFVDTSINNVNSYKSSYINIDCVLPNVATADDVTALRTLVVSALQNSIITDAIDSAQNPY